MKANSSPAPSARNRLTQLLCQSSCNIQEAIEMSRLMLVVQSDVLLSFKVFLDNATKSEERIFRPENKKIITSLN